MARRRTKTDGSSEATYPLGVVARMTGLSADVLRAWERRYGVVRPERTPGGSRRYREADIRRLRLLHAGTSAGFPIGDLVELDETELERRVARERPAPREALRATLDALEGLDAARAEELISFELAALGPSRFAREFACPLLREIGDGWESKRLCVASEHLGSALLRSMLGAALRPTTAALTGPRIVFGTPAGERHELGLLVAAVTALSAGASPLYLGPDLPHDELRTAAEAASAAAVALSLIALPGEQAQAQVQALRSALPSRIALWVGGPRTEDLKSLAGVERVETLEDLERKVGLLRDARKGAAEVR